MRSTLLTGSKDFVGENLHQHKRTLYVAYWSGYVILFSLLQGLPSQDFGTAFINELVSVLPKIIFVQLVVEYLVPSQFQNLRLFFFSAAYVTLVFVFAVIQRLIDNYIILEYFLPHWHKEPLMYIPPFLYNIIKLQFVVTLPLCIKLFSYWSRERNRKMQLQADKMETELQLLRSQFHPHFLFNVLNGLYSRIINGSADSAEIVLKISEMLRFGVYQSNGGISLEDEIKYLRNYVSLQKIRFDQRLEVSFSVHGHLDKYVIEPFIIQPFIENSFKHCMNNIDSGWITIAIERDGDWLIVRIENSLATTSGESQPEPGVGLQHVQKRLNLLYPNAHSLKIQKKTDSFFVFLRLKLLS
jgi:two-component system, LytTR family, sensor kinase